MVFSAVAKLNYSVEAISKEKNMANAVILPGERLAGLWEDLAHKVRKGVITLNEFALFTQRKNPFEFERNEHGHIVFIVTGLALTGVEEIERLESIGYRVSDYAKQCFMSTKSDSYNKKHRLVAGQSYKIALMPGREIEKDSDRTTTNLRKLGMEKYGYGEPLGGHLPRIRETVSDKQMEEMEFQYISTLHEPIKDSDGGPIVLSADRDDGGRWVSACWDDPGARWRDGGAFAFPVPAK